MSKVRDVVRARIKARIAARRAAEPGLGRVTLDPALERPSLVKTKAELQDELDAAGIEYPKKARKADLEALLNPTSEAEDVEAEQS